MTHRGRVKNGVVVFDDVAALPDGTKVSIRALKEKRAQAGDKGQIPTLYERMKDLAGIVDDLPPDASDNHDHYLYGTPKRT